MTKLCKAYVGQSSASRLGRRLATTSALWVTDDSGAPWDVDAA